MAATLLPTATLTFSEYEDRFGDDARYEYWFGRVMERSMPVWVHGLLQKIIMRLLDEAGFISASEVELRVIEEAHPKPDVIATRTKPTGIYPREAVEIAVEILSENDRLRHLRDKCGRYKEWGFEQIYLVDPEDRSILEWRDGALVPAAALASVAATATWAELHRQYSA